MNGEAYGDYIAYVAESGHSSSDPDPNFPCFVLAFCLFQKTYYASWLVARPIGLAFLRPDQPNRAYEILATKELHPTFTQTEFDFP